MDLDIEDLYEQLKESGRNTAEYFMELLENANIITPGCITEVKRSLAALKDPTNVGYTFISQTLSELAATQGRSIKVLVRHLNAALCSLLKASENPNNPVPCHSNNEEEDSSSYDGSITSDGSTTTAKEMEVEAKRSNTEAKTSRYDSESFKTGESSSRGETKNYIDIKPPIETKKHIENVRLSKMRSLSHSGTRLSNTDIRSSDSESVKTILSKALIKSLVAQKSKISKVEKETSKENSDTSKEEPSTSKEYSSTSKEDSATPKEDSTPTKTESETSNTKKKLSKTELLKSKQSLSKTNVKPINTEVVLSTTGLETNSKQAIKDAKPSKSEINSFTEIPKPESEVLETKDKIDKESNSSITSNNQFDMETKLSITDSELLVVEATPSVRKQLERNENRKVSSSGGPESNSSNSELSMKSSKIEQNYPIAKTSTNSSVAESNSSKNEFTVSIAEMEPQLWYIFPKKNKRKQNSTHMPNYTDNECLKVMEPMKTAYKLPQYNRHDKNMKPVTDIFHTETKSKQSEMEEELYETELKNIVMISHRNIKNPKLNNNDQCNKSPDSTIRRAPLLTTDLSKNEKLKQTKTPKFNNYTQSDEPPETVEIGTEPAETEPVVNVFRFRKQVPKAILNAHCGQQQEISVTEIESTSKTSTSDMEASITPTFKSKTSTKSSKTEDKLFKSMTPLSKTSIEKLKRSKLESNNETIPLEIINEQSKSENLPITTKRKHSETVYSLQTLKSETKLSKSESQKETGPFEIIEKSSEQGRKSFKANIQHLQIENQPPKSESKKETHQVEVHIQSKTEKKPVITKSIHSNAENLLNYSKSASKFSKSGSKKEIDQLDVKYKQSKPEKNPTKIKSQHETENRSHLSNPEKRLLKPMSKKGINQPETVYRESKTDEQTKRTKSKHSNTKIVSKHSKSELKLSKSDSTEETNQLDLVNKQPKTETELLETKSKYSRKDNVSIAFKSDTKLKKSNSKKETDFLEEAHKLSNTEKNYMSTETDVASQLLKTEGMFESKETDQLKPEKKPTDRQHSSTDTMSNKYILKTETHVLLPKTVSSKPEIDTELPMTYPSKTKHSQTEIKLYSAVSKELNTDTKILKTTKTQTRIDHLQSNKDIELFGKKHRTAAPYAIISTSMTKQSEAEQCSKCPLKILSSRSTYPIIRDNFEDPGYCFIGRVLSLGSEQRRFSKIFTCQQTPKFHDK